MNQGGKLLYLDPTDPPADLTVIPAEPNEASAPAPESTPAANEALAILTRLLRTEGFNPTTQLAGYLITEDPTYLPEDTEARAVARRVGRDKLLEVLIEGYLSTHPTATVDDPPCDR